MKEIKAIIQPYKLDAVLDALHEIEGLPGAVVSECRAAAVRGDAYEEIRKNKLEIMVPDDLVDRAVRAIQTAAHTGQPGDGRIFIIPIEESIVIRTAERGEDAR